MRTTILAILAAIIVVCLGCAAQALWSYRADCATCDTKCRSIGYPAGEAQLSSYHRVCECWPPSGEPAVQFLLSRR